MKSLEGAGVIISFEKLLLLMLCVTRSGGQWCDLLISQDRFWEVNVPEGSQSAVRSDRLAEIISRLTAYLGRK